MYSYSHEPDTAWLGTYRQASEALIAGRAAYDAEDAPTIYVARWQQAHYSDLFIGGATLLSYMREDGAEKMNDDDLAAFDVLQEEHKAQLDQAIRDVIGEWEVTLPEAQQFTGIWIVQVKGYRQGEEVRPGHWPAA